MPKDRGAHVRPTAPHSVAHPDDHSLVAAAIHGDDAALRTLMDRYDRLVRYTICTAKRQCVRDPQWLDTVCPQLDACSRCAPGKTDTLPTYLTATCGIKRQRAASAETRPARSPAPASRRT